MAHKIRMVVIGVFLFIFSSLFPENVVAQGKSEILIGAPLSLTGEMSGGGLEQKWAYERAIEAENKNGGILIKELNKKLPVRLIIEDDASDAGKVTSAVEKLITVHKVDLLLSTQNGTLVVNACAAAEKFQKYCQATACFTSLWKQHNFKWSTDLFFNEGSAIEVPFKILEKVAKNERPKNIGLVMEDDPNGVMFTQALKGACEKFGYSVAYQDLIPIGKDDYSSYIMKMKEKNVDAILSLITSQDAITLVRQIRELKLNLKYFHGWQGTWPGEFAASLGKKSDFIMSDGFWSSELPYPGAKELGDAYQKEFKTSSISVGLFYANAQILLQAIAKAGSYDSKKVRDVVVGNTFASTVMGQIKYAPDGVALFESIANQWVDGKRVLVYPFAGKWNFKLMPTDGSVSF